MGLDVNDVDFIMACLKTAVFVGTILYFSEFINERLKWNNGLGYCETAPEHIKICLRRLEVEIEAENDF